MSAPKKPHALKVVAGTDRPDRDAPDAPEFPEVENDVAAPAYLNVDGAVLWRELVPLLRANRVLTTPDLRALEHLCQLHGSIIAYYKANISPTAAELAQLRMLFGEFGMTPASRSKVRTGDGKKESNPFASNGKRPAA